MRPTEVIPTPWATRDMEGAFEELEHAADLWLEIRGESLAALFEHGLFALYSSLVDIREVLPLRSWHLSTWGADAAEALRSLLAEALYRFDAEALVGATARVEVRAHTDTGVEAQATVWGEVLERDRHPVLSEVKAVTYHQLAVEQDATHGWRASVVFDI